MVSSPKASLPTLNTTLTTSSLILWLRCCELASLACTLSAFCWQNACSPHNSQETDRGSVSENVDERTQFEYATLHLVHCYQNTVFFEVALRVRPRRELLALPTFALLLDFTTRHFKQLLMPGWEVSCAATTKFATYGAVRILKLCEGISKIAWGSKAGSCLTGVPRYASFHTNVRVLRRCPRLQ